MQHKVCNYCKIELPVESFSTKANGCFRSLCKKCNTIKAKEYYYKNIEQVREKARLHAREVFEQRKEYMACYRMDKKEELLGYAKKYYYSHRDHYLKSMEEYRAEHRDEMNAYKRDFYTKNRDMCIERNRAYYSSMPPEQKARVLRVGREKYEKNTEEMKAYHRVWSHENRERTKTGIERTVYF
jgi:hypothetical protein